MDPTEASLNDLEQDNDLKQDYDLEQDIDSEPSPNHGGISNGVVLNSSNIQRDPEIIQQVEDEKDEKDSRYFTINTNYLLRCFLIRKLFPSRKEFNFSIYKPLIPLKIALFVWYGAGATVGTFLLVFFKQRGLTLKELSIIYILSPLVQFFGPTICGIIADKIGRSKPVLVFNLILTVLIVVGMLLVPSMNSNCEPQRVKLKCHHNEFGRLIAKTSCDVNTDIIELSTCNVTCPENVTQYCSGQNLICEMLEGNEDFGNISLSVHVNYAYKLFKKCYYNVTSMSYHNISYSWCNVPHKMYCKINCLMNAEDNCDEPNDNRTTYLIINMILLILFFAVFSNTYRFMDVTAMCLVKEHNSDFGRQRLFSVAGILVFSPLAGFIVDIATAEGEDKYYDSCFYFFICLVFLMLGVIYKLEVSIRPPGKNMWKKSFYLLKQFDNVAFILVLFVLGSAWGFSKNLTSWYLEGMKVEGLLLGLINSVSALYGLPFLIFSNWWVKKIGTAQIFILGLLGYVASGIGYSLLYDPWLSLLIEVTSIFTYHLLWVAVIVHSHSIAPEGLTATVIATAGGVHYSLGKAAGGFFGGQIMEIFGGRIAYRVSSLACLLTAVLYAIYLYIRRTCFTRSHDLQTTGEIVKSENEKDENFKEIYVLQNQMNDYLEEKKV